MQLLSYASKTVLKKLQNYDGFDEFRNI